MRAAFSGQASPDLLIHCLSGKDGRNPEAYRTVYCQTLHNLLELLDPAFAVFTSSTSVYPQNDATEVDESSPTGGTPTGDILLEAEQLALQAGGAAVRLGGIYGPGRARFIEAALAGQPLPFGAPDAFINLIHRDDAARALLHVASLRQPGIFNAVDDHPSRRDDLAESIRTGAPTPANEHKISSGKRVRNTKLRRTGWSPRYPSILNAVEARSF